MSKTIKGGKSPVTPKVPTKEQIREWVRRDLHSAHYFMGILLRYPEIMDSCAQQIYDYAMKKENGPGIDHVETKMHASGK